ncbi:MAG: hypothetical protein ACXAAQ_15210 [Candidatus Thorarchaeota archaeon]|jgi:hypothetical protein
MLEKILPKQINNEFPGYKFSAYAFLGITIITVARSLAHMFLPDGGAGSIATIDLTVEGAVTIIGIFAQWGLSQLLMAVLYIVVYFRYKSLIPLMYIIIIAEYVGRIGVGLLKPIETMGTAPGAAFNFIIIPLAILLFIFAIREPTQESKPSHL